ncbi:MAG TPA: YggT family protein [Anaerolineae bacterium]
MSLLAQILARVIDLFTYLILIDIIASWIQVLNVRLPNWAFDILGAIHSIVEPVMAPVRRVMPNLGGLDFSPVIVLLLLQVISRALYGM